MGALTECDDRDHHNCDIVKDHINISLTHSGSKAEDKGGVPETMACRILVFILGSYDCNTDRAIILW